MVGCAAQSHSFFSSRRRHTRCLSDWSSDVCSSDLAWYRLAPRRERSAACTDGPTRRIDRKSVVEGKRVDLGGRRIIKKKKYERQEAPRFWIDSCAGPEYLLGSSASLQDLLPSSEVPNAAHFFSSRRRHTRCLSDWSSDVCSSDLSESPELDLKGDYLISANDTMSLR